MATIHYLHPIFSACKDWDWLLGKVGNTVTDLRSTSIGIIRRFQSETGAYVACPNFEMYRFCWLRDGTFIAYAMDRVGDHRSARKFYRWVASTLESQVGRLERIASALSEGLDPGPSQMLPTRYKLDGQPEDDSWPNFQLDGYGTWLWGLAEHIRMTGEPGLVSEVSAAVDLTVRYLSLAWQLPNYDCWEEFGDRVHPATLACLYGGLTAINRYLRRDDVSALAGRIRSFVLTHGTSGGRFVKSVGHGGVDASLIWLAVPFAVVEPQNPLMVATVQEIERRLYHQGVHRYPEDTYYGGGEWPLLASWLGWYYCRAGRPEAALPLLEWVESCASPSGELPEQVSTHVNAPEYLPEWQKRWGPVATPLLWSHAMYLVLYEELAPASASQPWSRHEGIQAPDASGSTSSTL